MVILKSTGLTPCSHKVTLVLEDSTDVLQSVMNPLSTRSSFIRSYILFLGCVLKKLFFLQVKIWFQNKRSKFKKLMKQGGGTIDTNALANGRGLSTGSPTVAPVWNSTATVKTSVGTPGSYIPSYTSWYPTAHQDSMQQPQLM